MKVKLLSALAIASLLFASCSGDDNEPKVDNGAIRFTSAINQQTAPSTRATNTSWAAGDAIGIYMVAPTVANSADNKQHTTTGGTAFAPMAGNEMYYPVNGDNVDFIAYYPYNATQSGMTYAVNVATQTSQPAIDLLWSNNATAKNKLTAVDVGLIFDHKLSKVVIKTVAGDGLDNTSADWKNMTISINGMDTKADFNLTTGVLGTSSAPAAISPKTISGGVQYEAIVLPANFAVDELVITFTVGNDTFTWKNPNATDGEFKAGTEYTYDMVVARTGVGFTCTINPWNGVPNRSGIAD